MTNNLNILPFPAQPERLPTAAETLAGRVAVDHSLDGQSAGSQTVQAKDVVYTIDGIEVPNQLEAVAAARRTVAGAYPDQPTTHGDPDGTTEIPLAA